MTKSPFDKDEEENYFEHRHFSMSQGVEKVIFELQYYYKRIKNPVFLGGSLVIEEPVLENRYGFSGSRLTQLATTMIFNKNLLKIPYSINIIFSHEDQAYWDKIKIPNSEIDIITPGIGFFWGKKSLAYSLNIQYPIYLTAIMSENAKNLNAESDALQISLSIRKILDYRIPWLYW